MITRRDPSVHSIRILYMPPVFAIISFFSYRFFRSYTYYSLTQIGKRHLFLSESHSDPVQSVRGISELGPFFFFRQALK